MNVFTGAVRADEGDGLDRRVITDEIDGTLITQTHTTHRHTDHAENGYMIKLSKCRNVAYRATVDHVEHTVRNSSLLAQSRQNHSSSGRALRRLQHEGVTSNHCAQQRSEQQPLLNKPQPYRHNTVCAQNRSTYEQMGTSANSRYSTGTASC